MLEKLLWWRDDEIDDLMFVTEKSLDDVSCNSSVVAGVKLQLLRFTGTIWQHETCFFGLLLGSFDDVENDVTNEVMEHGLHENNKLQILQRI